METIKEGEKQQRKFSKEQMKHMKKRGQQMPICCNAPNLIKQPQRTKPKDFV